MNQMLKAYMANKKAWFEAELPMLFQNAAITPKLKQAMLYSLEAGGKRIRPILLFATLHSLGKAEDNGLSTALGLEMIHTYSLIHDDLPAMDNDRLRRGKPTNHCVFGESTAILAGDGLLTAAFQLIANDPFIDENTRIKLVYLLAKAAGPEGMVGGQQDDLQAEEKKINLNELMSIHKRKTGRLIRFPVEAAAVIAKVDKKKKQTLVLYAEHLGLAFQIGDDILDLTGEEKALGKPVGSDIANHKNTYVSLLGTNGAKEKLEQEVNASLAELRKIGLENGLLSDLASYLLHRTY
ncbi:polyprenyl synthetase family protein [Sporolactobacillus shoreicorticis]|uniref:Polyprenyl synthetase family protein n=1 Tax=Sporolactobacillus shoreicorticis TaxID=1923877 RepID=A0ABW5S6Q5_9BACL|nr:farnesyl diphosphate synthase [Sporolactobacillus shoreicorticis]MCO7126594.1 polyprenyl synthetase family protein [Sporolactobacillus shoreicorticis]